MATFKDKLLKCIDCGVTFTFSAKEQESFQAKGFTHEPKRCLACRQVKRKERRGAPDQIFPAICAKCGKETEVPFQPDKDRPVYCRDCYVKK